MSGYAAHRKNHTQRLGHGSQRTAPVSSRSSSSEKQKVLSRQQGEPSIKKSSRRSKSPRDRSRAKTRTLPRITPRYSSSTPSKGSPRSSPRCSPKGSPRFSPRSSPRCSPRGSPRGSPRSGGPPLRGTTSPRAASPSPRRKDPTTFATSILSLSKRGKFLCDKSTSPSKCSQMSDTPNVKQTPSKPNSDVSVARWEVSTTCETTSATHHFEHVTSKWEVSASTRSKDYKKSKKRSRERSRESRHSRRKEPNRPHKDVLKDEKKPHKSETHRKAREHTSKTSISRVPSASKHLTLSDSLHERGNKTQCKDVRKPSCKIAAGKMTDQVSSGQKCTDAVADVMPSCERSLKLCSNNDIKLAPLWVVLPRIDLVFENNEETHTDAMSPNVLPETNDHILYKTDCLELPTTFESSAPIVPVNVPLVSSAKADITSDFSTHNQDCDNLRQETSVLCHSAMGAAASKSLSISSSNMCVSNSTSLSTDVTPRHSTNKVDCDKLCLKSTNLSTSTNVVDRQWISSSDANMLNSLSPDASARNSFDPETLKQKSIEEHSALSKHISKSQVRNSFRSNIVVTSTATTASKDCIHNSSQKNCCSLAESEPASVTTHVVWAHATVSEKKKCAKSDISTCGSHVLSQRPKSPDAIISRPAVLLNSQLQQQPFQKSVSLLSAATSALVTNSTVSVVSAQAIPYEGISCSSSPRMTSSQSMSPRGSLLNSTYPNIPSLLTSRVTTSEAQSSSGVSLHPSSPIRRCEARTLHCGFSHPSSPRSVSPRSPHDMSKQPSSPRVMSPRAISQYGMSSCSSSPGMSTPRSQSPHDATPHSPTVRMSSSQVKSADGSSSPIAKYLQEKTTSSVSSGSLSSKTFSKSISLHGASHQASSPRVTSPHHATAASVLASHATQQFSFAAHVAEVIASPDVTTLTVVSSPVQSPPVLSPQSTPCALSLFPASSEGLLPDVTSAQKCKTTCKTSVKNSSSANLAVKPVSSNSMSVNQNAHNWRKSSFQSYSLQMKKGKFPINDCQAVIQSSLCDRAPTLLSVNVSPECNISELNSPPILSPPILSPKSLLQSSNSESENTVTQTSQVPSPQISPKVKPSTQVSFELSNTTQKLLDNLLTALPNCKKQSYFERPKDIEKRKKAHRSQISKGNNSTIETRTASKRKEHKLQTSQSDRKTHSAKQKASRNTLRESTPYTTQNLVPTDTHNARQSMHATLHHRSKNTPLRNKKGVLQNNKPVLDTELTKRKVYEMRSSTRSHSKSDQVKQEFHHSPKSEKYRARRRPATKALLTSTATEDKLYREAMEQIAKQINRSCTKAQENSTCTTKCTNDGLQSRKTSSFAHKKVHLTVEHDEISLEKSSQNKFEQPYTNSDECMSTLPRQNGIPCQNSQHYETNSEGTLKLKIKKCVSLSEKNFKVQLLTSETSEVVTPEKRVSKKRSNPNSNSRQSKRKRSKNSHKHQKATKNDLCVISKVSSGIGLCDQLPVEDELQQTVHSEPCDDIVITNVYSLCTPISEDASGTIYSDENSLDGHQNLARLNFSRKTCTMHENCNVIRAMKRGEQYACDRKTFCLSVEQMQRMQQNPKYTDILAQNLLGSVAFVKIDKSNKAKRHKHTTMVDTTTGHRGSAYSQSHDECDSQKNRPAIKCKFVKSKSEDFPVEDITKPRPTKSKRPKSIKGSKRSLSASSVYSVFNQYPDYPKIPTVATSSEEKEQAKYPPLKIKVSKTYTHHYDVHNEPQPFSIGSISDDAVDLDNELTRKNYRGDDSDDNGEHGFSLVTPPKKQLFFIGDKFVENALDSIEWECTHEMSPLHLPSSKNAKETNTRDPCLGATVSDTEEMLAPSPISVTRIANNVLPSQLIENEVTCWSSIDDLEDSISVTGLKAVDSSLFLSGIPYSTTSPSEAGMERIITHVMPSEQDEVPWESTCTMDAVCANVEQAKETIVDYPCDTDSGIVITEKVDCAGHAENNDVDVSKDTVNTLTVDNVEPEYFESHSHNSKSPFPLADDHPSIEKELLNKEPRTLGAKVEDLKKIGDGTQQKTDMQNHQSDEIVQDDILQVDFGTSDDISDLIKCTTYYRSAMDKAYSEDTIIRKACQITRFESDPKLKVDSESVCKNIDDGIRTAAESELENMMRIIVLEIADSVSSSSSLSLLPILDDMPSSNHQAMTNKLNLKDGNTQAMEELDNSTNTKGMSNLDDSIDNISSQPVEIACQEYSFPFSDTNLLGTCRKMQVLDENQSANHTKELSNQTVVSPKSHFCVMNYSVETDTAPSQQIENILSSEPHVNSRTTGNESSTNDNKTLMTECRANLSDGRSKPDNFEGKLEQQSAKELQASTPHLLCMSNDERDVLPISIDLCRTSSEKHDSQILLNTRDEQGGPHKNIDIREICRDETAEQFYVDNMHNNEDTSCTIETLTDITSDRNNEHESIYRCSRSKSEQCDDEPHTTTEYYKAHTTSSDVDTLHMDDTDTTGPTVNSTVESNGEATILEQGSINNETEGTCATVTILAGHTSNAQNDSIISTECNDNHTLKTTEVIFTRSLQTDEISTNENVCKALDREYNSIDINSSFSLANQEGKYQECRLFSKVTETALEMPKTDAMLEKIKENENFNSRSLSSLKELETDLSKQQSQSLTTIHENQHAVEKEYANNGMASPKEVTAHDTSVIVNDDSNVEEIGPENPLGSSKSTRCGRQSASKNKENNNSIAHCQTREKNSCLSEMKSIPKDVQKENPKNSQVSEKQSIPERSQDQRIDVQPENNSTAAKHGSPNETVDEQSDEIIRAPKPGTSNETVDEQPKQLEKAQEYKTLSEGGDEQSEQPAQALEHGTLYMMVEEQPKLIPMTLKHGTINDTVKEQTGKPACDQEAKTINDSFNIQCYERGAAKLGTLNKAVIAEQSEFNASSLKHETLHEMVDIQHGQFAKTPKHRLHDENVNEQPEKTRKVPENEMQNEIIDKQSGKLTSSLEGVAHSEDTTAQPQKSAKAQEHGLLNRGVVDQLKHAISPDCVAKFKQNSGCADKGNIFERALDLRNHLFEMQANDSNSGISETRQCSLGYHMLALAEKTAKSLPLAGCYDIDTAKSIFAIHNVFPRDNSLADSSRDNRNTPSPVDTLSSRERQHADHIRNKTSGTNISSSKCNAHLLCEKKDTYQDDYSCNDEMPKLDFEDTSNSLPAKGKAEATTDTKGEEMPTLFTISSMHYDDENIDGNDYFSHYQQTTSEPGETDSVDTIPYAIAVENQSDDQTHQADDQAHQSDDHAHQSDDEVHQLDNQSHRSDDHAHQSDDEVHQLDNEAHRSDDEVHRSANKAHRQEAQAHIVDDQTRSSHYEDIDTCYTSPKCRILSREAKISQNTLTISVSNDLFSLQGKTQIKVGNAVFLGDVNNKIDNLAILLKAKIKYELNTLRKSKIADEKQRKLLRKQSNKINKKYCRLSRRKKSKSYRVISTNENSLPQHMQHNIALSRAQASRTCRNSDIYQQDFVICCSTDNNKQHQPLCKNTRMNKAHLKTPGESSSCEQTPNEYCTIAPSEVAPAISENVGMSEKNPNSGSDTGNYAQSPASNSTDIGEQGLATYGYTSTAEEMCSNTLFYEQIPSADDSSRLTEANDSTDDSTDTVVTVPALSAFCETGILEQAGEPCANTSSSEKIAVTCDNADTSENAVKTIDNTRTSEQDSICDDAFIGCKNNSLTCDTTAPATRCTEQCDNTDADENISAVYENVANIEQNTLARDDNVDMSKQGPLTCDTTIDATISEQLSTCDTTRVHAQESTDSRNSAVRELGHTGEENFTNGEQDSTTCHESTAVEQEHPIYESEQDKATSERRQDNVRYDTAMSERECTTRYDITISEPSSSICDNTATCISELSKVVHSSAPESPPPDECTIPSVEAVNIPMQCKIPESDYIVGNILVKKLCKTQDQPKFLEDTHSISYAEPPLATPSYSSDEEAYDKRRKVSTVYSSRRFFDQDHESSYVRHRKVTLHNVDSVSPQHEHVTMLTPTPDFQQMREIDSNRVLISDEESDKIETDMDTPKISKICLGNLNSASCSPSWYNDESPDHFDLEASTKDLNEKLLADRHSNVDDESESTHDTLESPEGKQSCDNANADSNVNIEGNTSDINNIVSSPPGYANQNSEGIEECKRQNCNSEDNSSKEINISNEKDNTLPESTSQYCSNTAGLVAHELNLSESESDDEDEPPRASQGIKCIKRLDSMPSSVEELFAGGKHLPDETEQESGCNAFNTQHPSVSDEELLISTTSPASDNSDHVIPLIYPTVTEDPSFAENLVVTEESLQVNVEAQDDLQNNSEQQGQCVLDESSAVLVQYPGDPNIITMSMSELLASNNGELNIVAVQHDHGTINETSASSNEDDRKLVENEEAVEHEAVSNTIAQNAINNMIAGAREMTSYGCDLVSFTADIDDEVVISNDEAAVESDLLPTTVGNTEQCQPNLPLPDDALYTGVQNNLLENSSYGQDSFKRHEKAKKPVMRNTAAQFENSKRKDTETSNSYMYYRKETLNNRIHMVDSTEIEEATNSIKEYEKVVEDETSIKTVKIVQYESVTTYDKTNLSAETQQEQSDAPILNNNVDDEDTTDYSELFATSQASVEQNSNPSGVSVTEHKSVSFAETSKAPAKVTKVMSRHKKVGCTTIKTEQVKRLKTKSYGTSRAHCSIARSPDTGDLVDPKDIVVTSHVESREQEQQLRAAISSETRSSLQEAKTDQQNTATPLEEERHMYLNERTGELQSENLTSAMLKPQAAISEPQSVGSVSNSSQITTAYSECQAGNNHNQSNAEALHNGSPLDPPSNNLVIEEAVAQEPPTNTLPELQTIAKDQLYWSEGEQAQPVVNEPAVAQEDVDNGGVFNDPEINNLLQREAEETSEVKKTPKKRGRKPKNQKKDKDHKAESDAEDRLAAEFGNKYNWLESKLKDDNHQYTKQTFTKSTVTRTQRQDSITETASSSSTDIVQLQSVHQSKMPLNPDEHRITMTLNPSSADIQQVTTEYNKTLAYQHLNTAALARNHQEFPACNTMDATINPPNITLWGDNTGSKPKEIPVDMRKDLEESQPYQKQDAGPKVLKVPPQPQNVSTDASMEKFGDYRKDLHMNFLSNEDTQLKTVTTLQAPENSFLSQISPQNQYEKAVDVHSYTNNLNRAYDGPTRNEYSAFNLEEPVTSNRPATDFYQTAENRLPPARPVDHTAVPVKRHHELCQSRRHGADPIRDDYSRFRHPALPGTIIEDPLSGIIVEELAQQGRNRLNSQFPVSGYNLHQNPYSREAPRNPREAYQRAEMIKAREELEKRRDAQQETIQPAEKAIRKEYNSKHASSASSHHHSNIPGQSSSMFNSQISTKSGHGCATDTSAEASRHMDGRYSHSAYDASRLNLAHSYRMFNDRYPFPGSEAARYHHHPQHETTNEGHQMFFRDHLHSPIREHSRSTYGYPPAPLPDPTAHMLPPPPTSYYHYPFLNPHPPPNHHNPAQDHQTSMLLRPPHLPLPPASSGTPTAMNNQDLRSTYAAMLPQNIHRGSSTAPTADARYDALPAPPSYNTSTIYMNGGGAAAPPTHGIPTHNSASHATTRREARLNNHLIP